MQNSDTYTYLNKIIERVSDKGYAVLARYNPKSLEKLCAKNEKGQRHGGHEAVFSLLFCRSEQKEDEQIYRTLSAGRHRRSPCAHLYFDYAASQGWTHQPGYPPCLGIITDYTLHIFWENMDIDYFVTGADFMIGILPAREFPLRKSCPSGFQCREN